MPFAITQNCCNDATCVAVCPVNCIHPTPEERAFVDTEMLYIDPKACINCGACADACPVEAIFPVESLKGPEKAYAEINAAFFETPDATGAAFTPVAADTGPNFHVWGEPVFDRVLPPDFAPLRVAVVGTGPSGMYAVQDLLLNTNAKVTLIDRLPVAGGLVRYGVAPDHPATKKVGENFKRLYSHPRTKVMLNVEVGQDITHDELAAHHDAVIYAVGAAHDRRLGIEGEDLPGSLPATRFVAWYNGHPDVAPDAVDLTAERVVVVGNGNVALDVARILVSDPEELAHTDIAEHALEALRSSKVREVVLLARRGPSEAAYTSPELLALKHLDGVELVRDDHDPRVLDAIAGASPRDKAALLADVPRVAVDWSAPPADGKRIVLRFFSSPVAVLGDAETAGLRVTGAEGETDIAAGMVLRAIGYRSEPFPGLPFDESSATIPHDAGRVQGMDSTYVVGWAKRGPSGGIGANRSDANETVGTLIADATAGRLGKPDGDARAFDRLVRRRTKVVGARGLAALERRELARGRSSGRNRLKFTTVDDLVSATRPGLLRRFR